MKVVLHQGFHKTGTTTLQRVLAKNRDILKDRVNLLLPRDLQDAGFSARRYAVSPKGRVLENFSRKLGQALAPFAGCTDKPLFISNEEFAGLIPGRKGVWSYAQTPVLAQAVLDQIARLSDGPVQVTLLYTTRYAADWIKSTYWQNLRSHRIVEDLPQYAAALQDGSDLETVVDRVRASVSNGARVVSINVSDLDDRSALLNQVLSLMDVSADGLVAIPDQNVQPEGAATYFLELNRSNLTDDEVLAVKRIYLDKLKARA